MNAADFLDAILPEYRAEMGPIVGFDFIDSFVVQNRPRLLRSLEPLMAMLAAERVPAQEPAPEACEACGTELEHMGAQGIGCPRCADLELDDLDKASGPQAAEDPDAVTPEKDAIVWAAFTKLVNQKRREFGMDEIEATESLPFLKKMFGRREPGRVLEDIESLPRFGTCGRTEKERRQAEHVADSYNASGIDARTSKSRACATVNARRNERLESMPSCGCSPSHNEMVESLPKPGRTRRSATDRKIDAGPIAITLRHHRRRDLVALVTASASEPGRFQVTWVDSEGPSGHTTRDTPEEAVRYAVEEGYRLDDATTNARDRDLVERVQQEREKRAAEIDSWVTEPLPAPRGRGPTGPEVLIRPDGEVGYVDGGEWRSVGFVVSERGWFYPRTLGNDPLRDHSGVIRKATQREAIAALLQRRGFDFGAVESLPHPRGRRGDGSEAFKPGEYVIREGDMLGMEGELGGYVKDINRNDGTANIEQDNGEIKPWPLDSLLHDTKENRAKRQAFDDQIAADASVRVNQAILEWKAR